MVLIGLVGMLLIIIACVLERLCNLLLQLVHDCGLCQKTFLIISLLQLIQLLVNRLPSRCRLHKAFCGLLLLFELCAVSILGYLHIHFVSIVVLITDLFQTVIGILD